MVVGEEWGGWVEGGGVGGAAGVVVEGCVMAWY